MTVTLFATILTIGSVISSLLTEAIKKMCNNDEKRYSSNIIALINAFVVGGLGTTAIYIFLGIPWTLGNVTCIIIMIFAVWIGCMVGFDKVTQTIAQIAAISMKK